MFSVSHKAQCDITFLEPAPTVVHPRTWTFLEATSLGKSEHISAKQTKFSLLDPRLAFSHLDQHIVMTTPDNLLALAAELAKLGSELSAVGGKLATAAAQLEQEAANLAEERAKRWGFEVQVAVGVKGVPGAGANNNTSVVEVKK